MAVASTMYNARCTDCGHTYYDPHSNQPCPRCDSERITAIGQAPASTPQSAAKPAAKAVTPRGGLLGLGALAIGIPLWLEGARTTRDGWVLFVNWILARLGAPYAVPASAVWPWWLGIGALVLLGFVYSHIEVKQVPMRLFPWYLNHTWQVWVVWVLFIVSDVGTMYLGARSPHESDPALLHQIAGAFLSAAIYATIITFVPERLVLFGWRKLRG